MGVGLQAVCRYTGRNTVGVWLQAPWGHIWAGGCKLHGGTQIEAQGSGLGAGRVRHNDMRCVG